MNVKQYFRFAKKSLFSFLSKINQTELTKWVSQYIKLKLLLPCRQGEELLLQTIPLADGSIFIAQV